MLTVSLVIDHLSKICMTFFDQWSIDAVTVTSAVTFEMSSLVAGLKGWVMELGVSAHQ